MVFLVLEGFACSTFFALGQSLEILVKALGDGQGEYFRGCPERLDDENGQDDPIVPPTDERLGLAGDERVMVHAGAVNGQPAFAAQGVVDGPKHMAGGREDAGNQWPGT